MSNLITKEILKEQARKKIESGIYLRSQDIVGVSDVRISGKFDKKNEELFSLMNSAIMFGVLQSLKITGKYQSVFEIPFGKRGSIFDRIAKGIFKPVASSNTLNADWQDLWDALRIDLSIRKTALPQIRQFIYNEITDPAFTRTIKLKELFPYGIIFDENTAEGQAVRQGQKREGQLDTFDLKVYAAGFTWTLLAELFDKNLDQTRLNDAVILGYNAKCDDLAISPILVYSYSGNQQTPADTTSDANKYELLYMTIEAGVEDLSQRTDPITGRKIAGPYDILASELDAQHINQVLSGQFPLSYFNTYQPRSLSAIRNVIGYDGETVQLREETVTYDGVTPGTCYLIKPKNRYFQIARKRGLTMEVDATPDVKTLAREERAWYFVEGLYYADALDYFVQEITLPTW